MNQSAEQKIETSVLTPEQTRPAKDPLSWSGPVERNMVKARINKISPVGRNRKEKDAWDAIKKEEEHEDRVAATTHVLLDQADKWHRKALSATNLAITTEAGKVGNKQKELMKLALDEADKRKQQVRAKIRKEMARLQEELVSTEKSIDEDMKLSQESITIKLKPQFDSCAARLEDARMTIPQRMADFAEDIKGLALDQLNELAAGGKITVVRDGAEKVISVPGTHKKERALAGEG